ncbi:MAG TPA: DUF2182 domain-containing protein [Actinophytocola sp.]|nr:DUF2182 domain-containing protein [Actinophytocola sp.]
MSSAVAPIPAPRSAPAAAPRRWQLRRERHPEWWLWVVAVAGGWVLVSEFLVGVPAAPAAGSGHGGHVHGGAPSIGAPVGLWTHAVAWLAMIAVMVPLITANVRFAARRSPRRARAAVTRNVVAGWAIVWVGAAIGLGVGGWLLIGVFGDLLAIALLTVAAVGWQHAPLKRRSLARCHGVLAPPLDRRRSRRACRGYGVGLGRDCVLSCWPLMALMAVAAHNPLVVASTVGVAWYERVRRPHHDPATRETSVAIVVIGVLALVSVYLIAHLGNGSPPVPGST